MESGQKRRRLEESPPPLPNGLGYPANGHHRAGSADVVHSSSSDSKIRTLSVEGSVKKRVIKPRVAPEGAVLTEKSCSRCRERKVKCDRIFPLCKNCKDRNEVCDLVNLLPKPKITKSDPQDLAKINELEMKIAQLQTQLTMRPRESTTSLSPKNTDADVIQSFWNAFGESPDSTPPANIGHKSIDWRLATPQMEKSLSQHLVGSFIDSCCFLLPTFNWFKKCLETTPKYQWDEAPRETTVDCLLTVPLQAAVFAFCAVGARTSPHSALLGISNQPEVSGFPEAPLLRAGTRRQNACRKLIEMTYTLTFQQGLEDEATEENLAALLAIIQLSVFNELTPRKSRTYLRAAIGHYKELINTSNETKCAQLKKLFAFAIYSMDCVTSAYAQKTALLSDDDLKRYFGHAGIIIPSLPNVALTPVLNKVLGIAPPSQSNFKNSIHLIQCWTCAAQRNFVKMVTCLKQNPDVLQLSIPGLWASIDEIRSSIQFFQSVGFSNNPQQHDHSSRQTHIHETDFVSMAVRSDRDLIDLVNMIHELLLNVDSNVTSAPDTLRNLLDQSFSRVRKCLKTMAFYSKLYLSGADVHMIYHSFWQMELNPRWTKMALQKVGELGGPKDASEEVTVLELQWFIEALQAACYYSPSAEKRLLELSPRFVTLDDASTNVGVTSTPSPGFLSDFSVSNIEFDPLQGSKPLDDLFSLSTSTGTDFDILGHSELLDMVNPLFMPDLGMNTVIDAPGNYDGGIMMDYGQGI